LSFNGVTSVLEVGCGPGQNLYLLSKVLPRASLHGIDISATAIEQAKREFAARGISGVHLATADVAAMSAFVGSAVDVVIADAVLFYVSPSRIENSLAEMLRVARRGLVLQTWDWTSPDGTSPWK